MLVADTTLITMLQKLYVHNDVKLNVSSVQNFSGLPQIPTSEIKYLGKNNLTWIWWLKVVYAALVLSEYGSKIQKAKTHRVRTQLWWDEDKFLSIRNAVTVKC